MNQRELEAISRAQTLRMIDARLDARGAASQAAQASCLGEFEGDGFYDGQNTWVKYFTAGDIAGSAPARNPQRRS